MSAPCITKSPAFLPKFESMSDEDLDVLELVYWAIVSGVDPGTQFPTYDAVQTLLAPANCWRSMTKRQRRELIISKMLNLSACWNAATMREVIRVTKAKTTLEQREASLDWLRYSGLTTQTCGSL